MPLLRLHAHLHLCTFEAGHGPLAAKLRTDSLSPLIAREGTEIRSIDCIIIKDISPPLGDEIHTLRHIHFGAFPLQTNKCGIYYNTLSLSTPGRDRYFGMLPGAMGVAIAHQGGYHIVKLGIMYAKSLVGEVLVLVNVHLAVSVAGASSKALGPHTLAHW